MSSSTSAVVTPAIFKLSSPLFCSILGNHLSASDIATGFARTCRLFREIGRQEQIWKLFSIAALGPPEQVPASWLTEAKLIHRMGVDYDAARLDKDGHHRLHIAAKTNDVESLTLLLDSGVDVDPTSALIFTASSYDSSAAARLLIERKADVNAENPDQRTTVLHHACEAGKLKIVRLLIAAQADVNKADARGRTPLHWTMRIDYHLVAQTLLEAKADTSRRDERGQTPLDLACNCGLTRSIQLLMAHRSGKPLPEIDSSANAYDEDAFDKFGNDWTERQRLLIAIVSGDLTAIRALVAAGASVNETRNRFGDGPLHTACELQRLQAAKLLIKLNADPESDNNWKWKPLYYGAITGNIQTAKLLLEQKVDINCRNEAGESPLMRAAMNNHEPFIRFMLANKADPAIQDNEGNTAAQHAAIREWPDIVELLDCAVKGLPLPAPKLPRS